MYCCPQLNLSTGCVARYCPNADCLVAAITPTNVVSVKFPASYCVNPNEFLTSSGMSFGGNTRFLYSKVYCELIAFAIAVELLTPAKYGDGIDVTLSMVSCMPFRTLVRLFAISSMSDFVALRTDRFFVLSTIGNSAVALMSVL